MHGHTRCAAAWSADCLATEFVSLVSDDEFEGDRAARAAVREAVLDYLREHPRAMDTLEGIAQWWLVRQRVRMSVELVARALEDLEQSGLVERAGGEEGEGMGVGVSVGQAMYRLRDAGAAADGGGFTETTGEPSVGGGT